MTREQEYARSRNPARSKTIVELLADVETAHQALQDAREALIAAVVAAAPHAVGGEFMRQSIRYKVVSISASQKDGCGWMMCRHLTSGKGWSIKQTPIPFKVE